MLLPPFHFVDKIFSNLSKELVFLSLRNFPTIIHRCSNESSDFRCFARPRAALWKNRGREEKLKGKKLHFLSTFLSLSLFVIRKRKEIYTSIDFFEKRDDRDNSSRMENTNFPYPRKGNTSFLALRFEYVSSDIVGGGASS